MKKFFVLILSLFLGIGVAIISSPKAQAALPPDTFPDYNSVTHPHHNGDKFIVIYTLTDEKILVYDDWWLTLYYFDISDAGYFSGVQIDDDPDHIYTIGEVYSWDAVYSSYYYESAYELPLGTTTIYQWINAIIDVSSNRNYSAGYAEGLIVGFQNGLESDNAEAYLQGYNAGVTAGLAHEANDFYDNIESWLVPAIIVVLFLGGFIAFARKKRDSVE
jgi:hypothetical protein